MRSWLVANRESDLFPFRRVPVLLQLRPSRLKEKQMCGQRALPLEAVAVIPVTAELADTRLGQESEGIVAGPRPRM